MKIAEFVFDPAPDIPDHARDMARLLLADTLGVAAGAVTMPAGRIARDTAIAIYGASDPAHAARLLFDGRRASVAGAAFAAASQIDNLDAHDGLNPTKGHIGCAIVPALFALAEARPDLSGRAALDAMVIGYEVAARAAFALHATVSDYHTSGAWNALGVAAIGCRLRGTEAEVLRHALGIAEYHGPRSQMMREIATPTMLHDGSGMGALIGVSAVEMAGRGFLGAPAITVEAPEVAPYWADLGSRWTIADNYIKPYPICRWAHAAIDALWSLQTSHAITAPMIARIDVNTFAEAAQLVQTVPKTTSEAQYSLGYALAVMALNGHIGPEHVDPSHLSDPAIAAMISRIHVAEAALHSSRFPGGRWSDVTVTLTDGRIVASGDVHARGGPEAPMELREIRRKFDRMTAPLNTPGRSEAIWAACRSLDDTPFAALARHVYPEVPA